MYLGLAFSSREILSRGEFSTRAVDVSASLPQSSFLKGAIICRLFCMN